MAQKETLVTQESSYKIPDPCKTYQSETPSDYEMERHWENLLGFLSANLSGSLSAPRREKIRQKGRIFYKKR